MYKVVDVYSITRVVLDQQLDAELLIVQAFDLEHYLTEIGSLFHE